MRHIAEKSFARQLTVGSTVIAFFSRSLGCVAENGYLCANKAAKARVCAIASKRDFFDPSRIDNNPRHGKIAMAYRMVF